MFSNLKQIRALGLNIVMLTKIGKDPLHAFGKLVYIVSLSVVDKARHMLQQFPQLRVSHVQESNSLDHLLRVSQVFSIDG